MEDGMVKFLRLVAGDEEVEQEIKSETFDPDRPACRSCPDFDECEKEAGGRLREERRQDDADRMVRALLGPLVDHPGVAEVLEKHGMAPKNRPESGFERLLEMMEGRRRPGLFEMMGGTRRSDPLEGLMNSFNSMTRPDDEDVQRFGVAERLKREGDEGPFHEKIRKNTKVLVDSVNDVLGEDMVQMTSKGDRAAADQLREAEVAIGRIRALVGAHDKPGYDAVVEAVRAVTDRAEKEEPAVWFSNRVERMIKDLKGFRTEFGDRKIKPRHSESVLLFRLMEQLCFFTQERAEDDGLSEDERYTLNELIDLTKAALSDSTESD